MTTLLTIRTPEGETYPIAIDGDRFVEPSDDVTTEIDTASLWALPGLADAHAHLTMTSVNDIRGIDTETMLANISRNAWAHVDNGVLLILDKGGDSDITLVTLDHDADIRPDAYIAAGVIHPAAGYMQGFGDEVEPEDLVEFIRAKAVMRGGWVKIVADWPRRGVGPVTNYPLETLREAVDVVHHSGARVAVHTMAYAASDAVAAGVDSIEHGPFLTRDDLTSLGARGGAWVPTLLNMQYSIDLLGQDSSGGKILTRGLEQMRETLPLAQDLGVVVLAGTDMAVPHGQVAQEAIRLKEYGLTDMAATQATSTSAYSYIGRPDSIAPGEIADVVFFAQDPFEDVTTLLRPELIIHRGKIIG
ncbi:MAG: amidohydrolase family protein [Actinomycetota bacterium]